MPVLDLDYAEDSAADADANFILTQGGGIVEIQATAEKSTFDDAAFAELLALGAQRHGRVVRGAESHPGLGFTPFRARAVAGPQNEHAAGAFSVCMRSLKMLQLFVLAY